MAACLQYGGHVDRDLALRDADYFRTQPINEIMALASGRQIQNPNFINTGRTNIPTTDFAGIQANYDNILQQQFQ